MHVMLIGKFQGMQRCVLAFMCTLYILCYTDFVRQHWLQAAAEVAEIVSILVDLHALPVIFDFRIHPVGTFLHGVLDGFTCLCLKLQKKTSLTELYMKMLAINNNTKSNNIKSNKVLLFTQQRCIESNSLEYTCSCQRSKKLNSSALIL